AARRGGERGHARDRPLCGRDPDPRHQRAVLRLPGLRALRRRRPAEARPHDDLRRGPPLPGAGQPLPVARRPTREAAGLRAVPVDDGVRGLPGVGGGDMTATVVKLRDQWFEYADVLVDVMIGYACNVQCDYCSITDEMRKENMALLPVMAALAEARRRGAVKVAFGGGEPTIRQSLLPLVRWCRDRGYRSIKIPSNGLMYS